MNEKINRYPGQLLADRELENSQELISKKVFPELGWYHFTDDTFSPFPIEGKVIKGIVAYFEKGVPQSISIEEQVLPYCNMSVKTGATSKTDGKSNTTKAIEACSQQNATAVALEWIVAHGGIGPANEQWLKIVANLDVINASLEYIKAPLIKPTGWYLSSTDTDKPNGRYVYQVRPFDGFLSDFGVKVHTCCVRYIIA